MPFLMAGEAPMGRCSVRDGKQSEGSMDESDVKCRPGGSIGNF
jgi:hypothetical protein